MTKKGFWDTFREFLVGSPEPSKEDLKRLSEQHGVQFNKQALVMRLNPISKDNVLRMNTEPVRKMIEAISEELGREKILNPWNMTISGYDLDPRPLWGTPEVMKYYQKVQKEFPLVACLLSVSTAGAFLYCLVELEANKEGIAEGIVRSMGSSARPKTVEELLNRSFGGRYFKVKLPEEQQRLTEEILTAGKNFFGKFGFEQAVVDRLMNETRERIDKAFSGEF